MAETAANAPESSHTAANPAAGNAANHSQAGGRMGDGHAPGDGPCKTCGRPMGEERMATVSQVPFPTRDKLANPGPTGLLAFAITTFVLGLYQCGAGLPNSNPKGDVGPDHAIFGLAVFMGGVAQFVAGIFEFRVGNTFGSTVHLSYGAFWLSYAMFKLPTIGIEAHYGNDMRAFTFAIGIYLILWCFLTIIFLIAALRTNLAILGVFFFLALAFLLLSISEFLTTENLGAATRVNKAGGAIAVVDAFIAFYAGASGLMRKETTFVRFPLGAIPEHWGRRFERGEKV